MATSFHSDAGGLRAEQSSGSSLDYTLDWAESLDAGDVIADSQWSVEAGIVAGQQSYDDSTTTAWLSGGVGGRSYAVTNTIVTSSGRRDTRTFRVFVTDAGGLGSGIKSVLGSLPQAIAALRRDRLMGPTRAWMPNSDISDEYILDKLLAAERYVERRLRTFLTPREILPSGATEQERLALEAAGETVVDDPGHDMEPGNQGPNAWGPIDLRHRPVIAIHSIRFAFPSPTSTVLEIPAQWLRLDKKYGRLQFVPVQSAGAFGAFSGLILTALSSNNVIPQAYQIRYRAGLENAARDYPDLLNLVKRLAVLDILDDQFLPTSGSTSVDGLSQSTSWDASGFRQAIDDKLDALRQSMAGIRLSVF